jgi:hypothetical protein
MLLKDLSLWPKSTRNDSNILSEKGKQCNCSVDCPHDGGEIGQKLTGTQFSGLNAGHTVFTSTGIYWPPGFSHVYFTHLSPGGDHVSFTYRTRRRWCFRSCRQIMHSHTHACRTHLNSVFGLIWHSNHTACLYTLPTTLTRYGLILEALRRGWRAIIESLFTCYISMQQLPE